MDDHLPDNQIRIGTAMKYKIIGFLVLGSLCAPHTLWSQDALTDLQRKAIVYDIYAGYREDFPNIKEISAIDAMTLLATGQKVVFVDTRKPEEMRVSMLPQAITKQAFLDSEDTYQGYMVIGYCTISYRSGVFAREMAQKGVTIHNLKGGILAWTLEGGSVYDGKGVTHRVHVYGKRWNYAPQEYEAVMFSLWRQLF